MISESIAFKILKSLIKASNYTFFRGDRNPIYSSGLKLDDTSFCAEYELNFRDDFIDYFVI
jgi:hypothetical protein